ncbi:MAG: M1 family aminopeptidase, partial [Melioribacteraceae bacterium]
MKITIIFITLFILSFSLFAQETNIHHNLKVNINPSTSSIEVVDELLLKSVLLKEDLLFTLHDNFNVELLTNGLKLKITKKSFSAKDIGMDRDDAESKSTLKLNEYSITGFDKGKDITLALKYSGKISSPIKQSEENYQRGFSESPGIISDLGIYLAGSTYWIPTFDDEMVSFNLTTELPEGWKNVTQGKRTDEKTENGIHTDTWDSPTPQEEVFLIAAKFTEYKYSMGSVDAMAFLRTPDEGIANKYLETTAQYMEMYRGLIGPFPYTKFALVENFWETGYGMPSFTLLGEKIIRFPFILHSSYPHELLHNWWGNSVYVDFEKGNWCEGITAYMADHLIKEQRGQGVEYRRSTLQKFTNFVNETNDFPLSKFLSRHDGPSEAIGYGKALMMFHMLRRNVGDEQFIKSFQVFNRNNKYKKASYNDIRIAFEEVTGKDLNWFFDQWVSRKGAPILSLEGVSVESFTDVNIIKFNLRQTQKGESFILDVPITFVTEEGSQTKVFHMTEKEGKFHFTTKTKPYKILVDAQFDVFRKLDANETPPAFTKAYGSKKALMILPSTADKNYKLYEKFANSWMKNKEDKFEIKNQSEIKILPSD